MKYLFISDLHISSKKSKQINKDFNLPIQFLLMEMAIDKIIQEEYPDYIIIGGDFIDKQVQIPLEDITFSIKMISNIVQGYENYNPKIFILKGNHDTISYDSDLKTFPTIFTGIPNIHPVNNPYIYFNKYDRTLIGFLPYEKAPKQLAINMKELYNQIEDFEKSYGKNLKKILVSHNDLDIIYQNLGILIEDEKDEEKTGESGIKYNNFKQFFDKFDLVLYGHIHSYVDLGKIKTITSFHPTYSFGEGIYLKDLVLISDPNEVKKYYNENNFDKIYNFSKKRYLSRQHKYYIVETDINNNELKITPKDSPYTPIFITLYSDEVINEEYLNKYFVPILEDNKKNYIFLKVKISNLEYKPKIITKIKELQTHYPSLVYVTFEVDSKAVLENKKLKKQISQTIKQDKQIFSTPDALINYIQQEGLVKLKTEEEKNTYANVFNSIIDKFKKEIIEKEGG